jgi:hypothetical protein
VERAAFFMFIELSSELLHDMHVSLVGWHEHYDGVRNIENLILWEWIYFLLLVFAYRGET